MAVMSCDAAKQLIGISQINQIRDKIAHHLYLDKGCLLQEAPVCLVMAYIFNKNYSSPHISLSIELTDFKPIS